MDKATESEKGAGGRLGTVLGRIEEGKGKALQQ